MLVSEEVQNMIVTIRYSTYILTIRYSTGAAQYRIQYVAEYGDMGALYGILRKERKRGPVLLVPSLQVAVQW